jgi:uncharacterized protein with NRDE domain
MKPKIFAGRDPVGGGTWLGVNVNGVIAALSNRKSQERERLGLRSRGLLCLDALVAADADAGIRIARNLLKRGKYNPFNLLCGNAKHTLAIYHSPEGDRVEELTPGVHVLTTGDVDDHTLPKVARAQQLLANAGFPADMDKALELLKHICRDHEGRKPSADSLCMHGQHAGTLSSSIVSVTDEGTLGCYWHVQSFPCRGRYLGANVSK